MKNKFQKLGILALMAASTLSHGRNPVNGNLTKPVLPSYKTEVADCRIPVSSFDLSINNVRAKLQNGGDMWWDFDNPKYEVPKGDGSTTGIHAIFAGAIWVSALDNGGNLKLAAQLFRRGNSDFFAGPLDADGAVSSATCNRWDKHFVVYGREIGEQQAAWAKSNGAPISVSDNLKFWPSKGNVALKAAGYEVDGDLASFFDQNGDGIYDPTLGDYPVIPCGKNPKPTAFADQMIFWVMNDKGNVHTATGGVPMGIQVNALAFAFQSTDDINNMTFYNYQIWNKSGVVYNNTCMTQYADIDLGCSENDRIGCDVNRSLGICYNGELNGNKCDNGASCLSGTLGYGCELPIIGIDFFEGPKDTSGRQLGMSAFQYFNRTGTGFEPGTEDPVTAVQFRNYQTGRWKNGTPVTYGGSGYQCTSTPIPYVYPGDPTDATAWSECNPQCGPAINAGDRRILQTAGPFTFLSGTKQNITIGVVWVRPNGGVGSNCPNFSNAIGRADDLAQALFDDCFRLIDGPAAPTLQVRELDREIILNIVNEPTSNNFGEMYNEVGRLFAKNGLNGFVTGMDSTYTFEGYKIYQLANDKISATDLNEPVDPTKAVLVSQMDVKNGITRLVNYERDALLGVDVPTIKVIGGDKGIEHSLKITEDFIKGGKLINHKTYYYAAVAYAANRYKAYDPLVPSAGGQKTEYLQGSKNFNRYTAIPHKQDPRNEGTVIAAPWGSATEVTRVEGKGNAGNTLNLTSHAVNQILSAPNQFVDSLLYAKNFDPIGFRITDPMAVKEADFELKVIEDSFYTYRTFEFSLSSSIPPVRIVTQHFDEILSTEDIYKVQLSHKVDSVPPNPIVARRGRLRWNLDEYNSAGAFVQTIASERYLQEPYEQLIYGQEAGKSKSYGFSIRLGNPLPVYRNNSLYFGNATPAKPVYNAIGGSLEFVDNRNPWLLFIKDGGFQGVENWIRSGTYEQAANQPDALIWDDAKYTVKGNQIEFIDSIKYFDHIAEGTWAPYCLTSNYNIGTSAPAPGQPASTYGPGFKWSRTGLSNSPPVENNLHRLFSVDIVFTDDKSKWSRCVVFETGENSTANQGFDLFPVNSVGAKKGMIRGHLSVDKDGKIMPEDTGRSWFPGYAINTETGERVNIAFGEASELNDANGNDMIWNPTDKAFGNLNTGGSVPYFPYFGGKHFIYVTDTRYDEGAAMQRTLLDNYYAMGNISNVGTYPTAVLELYRSLIWTSIPYLSKNFKLKSMADGLVPQPLTVRIRVERPLERLATAYTKGDSLPRYRFSTRGLAAVAGNDSVAKSALDLIRIVPNPYLAHSAYERLISDNRVKIINLPNRCDITIYTLDGQVVKRLSRAVGANDPLTQRPIDISDGALVESTNIDNSVNWDLTNEKNVPVSSGIYIFDINAPGLGHKILKWFGAMRPTDISSF